MAAEAAQAMGGSPTLATDPLQLQKPDSKPDLWESMKVGRRDGKGN